MSEYVSDAHAEYDRQQVEKLIRADQCIRELEAKVERLCKKYEKDTGRQAKIVADQRAENERLREVIRDFVEHPDPWTLARARRALDESIGPRFDPSSDSEGSG